MKKQGPWATPRSWAMVEEVLGKKATQHFKEFDILNEELPAPPTYEQAVVNMYREAKGIVDVGARLKQELGLARRDYFIYSDELARARARSSTFVDVYEKHICDALDNLWLAQGKYEAWAATYGGI